MKTKEQIEEALILATSDPYNAEDILDDSDAIMEIVNEFAEEWEDADCDDEDATPEQKAELDALLAKYTDRIHDVINKPHSIEYSYYDQRLRWYDANGLQGFSEFRPFTWWDIDVYNVLNELGYDSNQIDKFMDELKNELPFDLPSQDECIKLIESVLDGSKQVEDLHYFCDRIDTDTYAELIESGQDAESIFDEIHSITEN